MIDVTVCTPSIPERAELLEDAMESVRQQTVRPRCHLVRVESCPAGQPPMVHLIDQRNALLSAVRTQWTAGLDDDDVYFPNYFEVLGCELGPGIDVVYSRGVRVGVPGPPGWETGDPPATWPRTALAERLSWQNVIPSNAIVRTSLLREIGGWSAEGYDPDLGTYGDTPVQWDDWHLWTRLVAAGARVRFVGDVLYDYRQEAPNRLTADA